jgi:uncharacterized protein (TIGR00369 family)
VSKITKEEVREIIETELPWAVSLDLQTEEIGEGWCRVRLPHQDLHLRPGGTISGLSMMTVADFALYVAVMSVIGRVVLAVTTNLSINFLRKPKPGAILAEARMMKVGQRLAVGEVSLRSEGEDEQHLVAHATGTYSIPPRDQRKVG